MCGIFGAYSESRVDLDALWSLAKSAKRRGRDSSGYIWYKSGHYQLLRADVPITQSWNSQELAEATFIVGHSRLITHGQVDNQPVVRDDIAVLHNGIVLNTGELWNEIGLQPTLQVDSEIIPALASHFIQSGYKIDQIPSLILQKCLGSISAILLIPSHGKLVLLSNTGSLFCGKIDETLFISSERYHLKKVGCRNISQIVTHLILDIPKSDLSIRPPISRRRSDLVPPLRTSDRKKRLLEYEVKSLTRCRKCILPSTMPFIEFDKHGVCNYCKNYQIRNRPKPAADLEEILKVYRRGGSPDCVFPFSGGRDSSYGLHLAIEQFGLRPITFTYDWGMVTDLGRRNISLMCSKLGVENVLVAADIAWKRRNIRKNLIAWLRAPHLGMLNILTAGDKHFYRHIESLKKETGISLNVWSVNPLEVTHFKTGFLGLAPDFDEEKVFRSGLSKQLEYQGKRLVQYCRNPAYLNLSLIDTLTGEYFRSRKKKTDYYHLFDYWRWDEDEIDKTLEQYGWERATDTSSTWRIGDGSAAFYNYVYHRVAGFSEHDTFRSNQIREGQISRTTALDLASRENLPRYENIYWYLEVLGLSFEEVISKVNLIPRME
jgi:glucosamine--fructose-6-phosphate aminotransferase (isomerizing)